MNTKMITDAFKSKALQQPEVEGEHDMVNHPPHYKAGKIEVIEFIEDQQHLGFHRLQAIRYICRSPFKGTEKQDIEKAMWYLKRFIAKQVKVKHD